MILCMTLVSLVKKSTAIIVEISSEESLVLFLYAIGIMATNKKWNITISCFCSFHPTFILYELFDLFLQKYYVGVCRRVLFHCYADALSLRLCPC